MKVPGMVQCVCSNTGDMSVMCSPPFMQALEDYTTLTKTDDPTRDLTKR